MIFERLSLHNFGAYHGEHSLQLSTTAAKPVVLIGALNGSGKTTILEAVQLALFGKAVRGTSRSKMSYTDYLLQTINRNADPSLGAAVSLEFRQRQGGHDDVFSVTRTWRKVADSAKESLTVLRNGVDDPEATERWLEFVEEFLPVQIADLFLFDGERIESLADPERSTELLRTGVHGLLGLDLVDHLARSLLTLERRKRSQDSSAAQAEAALAKLEAERAQLQERIDTLTQSRGSAQVELDQLRKQLATIRQSLVKEGGALFSKREELKSQHEKAVADLEKQQALLQELATGEAPLLMVQALLPSARELVDEARSAGLAKRVLEELKHRDSELLRKLTKLKVSSSAQEEIKAYLKESKGKYSNASSQSFGLGAHASLELSDASLEDVHKRARSLLRGYLAAQEALAASELRMAAIPTEDSLKVHLDKEKTLADEVSAVTARIALIDEELRGVHGHMERMKAQLESRREEFVAAKFADQDANRIVQCSERARATLKSFREAVAAKNVARLEQLVAERFKALLRKSEGPVSGVRIDPKTFELQLLDGRERLLDPMLLSAGERQLLAVATVWALAKASGRALPTIIDTPLGRLDSEHRTRLVDNYFPAASHQVILLSTDEEINGRYYARLKPKIAREYVIQYDSALQSSRIEPGYFVQREIAA
jgi:DNA sulfur modification protein DndD